MSFDFLLISSRTSSSLHQLFSIWNLGLHFSPRPVHRQNFRDRFQSASFSESLIKTEGLYFYLSLDGDVQNVPPNCELSKLSPEIRLRYVQCHFSIYLVRSQEQLRPHKSSCSYFVRRFSDRVARHHNCQLLFFSFEPNLSSLFNNTPLHLEVYETTFYFAFGGSFFTDRNQQAHKTDTHPYRESYSSTLRISGLSQNLYPRHQAVLGMTVSVDPKENLEPPCFASSDQGESINVNDNPGLFFCDHEKDTDKKLASTDPDLHFQLDGALLWGIISLIAKIFWICLVASIGTFGTILSLTAVLSWRALRFSVATLRDVVSYTHVKLCNLSSSMATRLSSISFPCNPFLILLALEFTLLDRFTFFKIPSILIFSSVILSLLVRVNQHLASFILPRLDTSLKTWFYLRPQDTIPKMLELMIGLALWSCITLFIGEYGVLNPEIRHYLGQDVGSWVISTIGVTGHYGTAAALAVLLANVLFGNWILWLNEDNSKRDQEQRANNAGETILRFTWFIIVFCESIFWAVALYEWVVTYRMRGCRLGDYWFGETCQCNLRCICH